MTCPDGCSHAPGTGATCSHAAVSAHYAKPAADGSDPTADMRDGDGDSGSTAPAPIPGSGPALAGRGTGTP